MEEKEALDELLFIKKVISDSKKIIADNGLSYIVWGILVDIGMIGAYLNYKYQFTVNYIYVWILLIALGWFFALFYYKLRKKETHVETFAGKIMGALWFAAGISMSVAGLIGFFSGSISGDAIAPVVASILGAPYFISSLLNGQTWFKILALLWWTGAAVMFFTGGFTSVIIMIFLMTFGQIVPGIILYINAKKQCCD